MRRLLPTLITCLLVALSVSPDALARGGHRGGGHGHGSSHAGGSVRSAATPAGNGYFRGPRGGCYTLTASGKKRYVAHSKCQ